MHIIGYFITIGFFFLALLFPFANEQFILKGVFMVFVFEFLSLHSGMALPFFFSDGLKIKKDALKNHWIQFGLLSIYTFFAIGVGLVFTSIIPPLYFIISTYLKYIPSKARGLKFTAVSFAVFIATLVGISLLEPVIIFLFPLPPEIARNIIAGGSWGENPQIILFWGVIYFSLLMIVDLKMTKVLKSWKRAYKLLLASFFVVLAIGLVVSSILLNQNKSESYYDPLDKYEIIYPSDKVDIVFSETLERGTEGDPGFRIKSGGHFAMGAWNNPRGLSAEEWLDEMFLEYSGGWLGEFEETMVGELQAVRATRTDGCYIEWVLIPQDKKIFTFGAELCDKPYEESLETFNEIVGTFILD